MLLTLFGVVFTVATPPVLADHTSAHAEEEIWEVADRAELDMDGIVSGFDDHISELGSESEVESAEDAADDALKAIWDQAKLSIENLVKLYPGELGPVGGDAKTQVQSARQASRDLVSSLADDWQPPTSTTTPAVTTTTPAPATTSPTIAEPPKGGTTSPPAPNNGGSNNGGNNSGNNSRNNSGANNGGGQPPPPGSENLAEPSPTPSDQPFAPGPSGPASPVPEPSESARFTVLATLTPGQPAMLGPEAVSDFDDSEVASATDRMGVLLDAVLPPAIVDLVLSPLLVLEILIGTIVDGGLRVIGPLLLLGVFALGIFRYDRSTRRVRFPDLS